MALVLLTETAMAQKISSDVLSCAARQTKGRDLAFVFVKKKREEKNISNNISHISLINSFRRSNT